METFETDNKETQPTSDIKTVAVNSALNTLLGFVWVTYDEYGELNTEFIYPEKEPKEIPNTLKKDLRYMHEKTKAVRVAMYKA